MTDMDMGGEVSSDDKLWAALCYVFAPLVPIIVYFMEDKKSRPFIRFAAVQSTVFVIALWAITLVLSWAIIGLCIGAIGFIAQLYWAYQSFQGEVVTIPVITDFIKNQGWA